MDPINMIGVAAFTGVCAWLVRRRLNPFNTGWSANLSRGFAVVVIMLGVGWVASTWHNTTATVVFVVGTVLAAIDPVALSDAVLDHFEASHGANSPAAPPPTAAPAPKVPRRGRRGRGAPLRDMGPALNVDWDHEWASLGARTTSGRR